MVPADAAAAVRSLIERRAAHRGGRASFVEGSTGREITWAEVHGTTSVWDRVRDRLGPGACVGLLCADPLEAIGAYLGALAAGVAVAPLDPTTTAAGIATAVARLDLAGVATDLGCRGAAEAAGLRPGSASPALGGSEVLWPAGPAGRHHDGGHAGGAAVVLASSGTTGEPKLIPLGAGQLLATARRVAACHELAASDVGYSPLPLFHINGLVVGVLTTVVTGGTLVVDRRFSASRFWATVASRRVSWLNLVPAMITVLAASAPPPPEVASRIAFARSASAPLPTASRRAFEQRCGIGVLETYGMTEAASQITANPRDPAERRPGSVGRAEGVDLRIVDRSRRPIGPDAIGEVQIRGPRIAGRYWAPGPEAGGGARSRPAAAPDGWLATGDLGRLDDDGFLYLVGRVDDVINRGGEKIFPREVEEVLLADAGVSAAAVVGRRHPVVGEEPVAFVLPAPAGADAPAGTLDALVERLTARCETELSRFKRPAQIIVAHTLPAGPTGKVRRAELRRAVASAPAGIPVP